MTTSRVGLRNIVATCIAAGLSLLLLDASAGAQSGAFRHVVVIVQENRTPDNLFQGLCSKAGACSAHPTASQYDIQTGNWLNSASPRGVTQPFGVPLQNSYDLGHSHQSFLQMCDRSPGTQSCRMDGDAANSCVYQCIANPQFAYVENSRHILDPYLALAAQYGWANYMFQTNQGPSFPAHQFLFSATSAPSAADDHAGTFAAEEPTQMNEAAGCEAPADQQVQLIDGNGIENPNNLTYPCFEHETLADLLTRQGHSWRYYTPTEISIWSAPNAIDHICKAVGHRCSGAAWRKNVDPVSKDVLADIAGCRLRNVSWVIPSLQNSDHAYNNTGGGPSWVASIVNAIGNSGCKDGSDTYWDDTAIFVTWDDWGGWYDHVPPPPVPAPQGGYQYGFRVPLLVVSAYTPKGYIDDRKHDFGSITRFIERNFHIPMGALTFADARAKSDLFTFFDFTAPARPFQTIPAPHDAKYFLNDKSPQLPPDDD